MLRAVAAVCVVLGLLMVPANGLGLRLGARKMPLCVLPESKSHTQQSLLETSKQVSLIEEDPAAEGKFKETYKYIGCYAIENDEMKLETPKLIGMTPEKCYSSCKGKQGEKDGDAKFFMLKNGRECSCLKYIDKNISGNDESNCSTPCPGDKRKKCGGVKNDSVYVMIKCQIMPKSEAEKVREAQMKETLAKIEDKKE